MKVIQVDFQENLSKMLEELPEKMREIALKVLNERAEVMVETAKALCPVDTGSLKKSIRRQRTSKGVAVRAGGYIINPKTRKIVNYAGVVESKQPFMRLAWTVAREGIVQEIEERVASECSK